MRSRDLGIRSTIILVLLTVAAIFVSGYHPGVEDDFVYLPAIKFDLHPALYPQDADFFRLQLQATIFDKVVAASVRLTHMPLTWALLIWQAAAIFLVLLGCWKIARRCFAEERSRWAGVTLIAVLLTMPVAGTSLFLVDQHLHPRALATAFCLFGITAILDRRILRAVLWIALAFTFHPIMAAFGASYCVFLAWPQTWMVFPHGHERDQTAPLSRSTRTAATRSSAALLPLGFLRPLTALIASAVPLGWIFEKPTPAWREAAGTRSYYFLGRQTWYEWLGTFAPLLILWWFSRVGERPEFQPGDNTIARWPDRPMAGSTLSFMSRRLIWFGIFQFAVTLAIMIPPQIERFRTLQPLRYLHLVYLLMLLFAGGLIGKYILKAKIWRWALLFVPIACGMFWSQRMEFPDTPHWEMPWNTAWHGPASRTTNQWVKAFLWVRNNTPADAYFALGPRYYQLAGEDWHSFRALAERSQLADAVKDPSVSTQVPRLAVRWQRESHAQDGWEFFQKPDFQRLKRDFGVNWVVLDHDVAGLQCPYVSPAVRVCHID